ncbi:hypothetical protein ACU5B6_09180 [Moritella viscosa]|uniref:hypothetical protein n=1 Tax=Moritella viscosa TaxID=80854 RepID=UPI0009158BA8|nr:hypothetical protein [Moritella viscosa]SHO02760.1 Putative ribosome biogenesis GTPase RsgA [Moritella viscosa]SHO04697.1 Putative ribosome biogenesis GTPase RsgA [Moritella viscosa]SHO07700.1 Putative ribosome biogenesis GTPase RsgA [Moritella viscosa]
MKSEINTNLFLALPNEIMNTKHPLHYELLNFDTNIKLKVFLAILAKSTMIYKTTKKRGIQTFSIKGLLGRNSFIPRSKAVNHKKLLEIINNFNSPFFKVLSLDDKEIQFELSLVYKKTLMSGFSNINLMDLKQHKDLKTTKLAIITSIYPNGYFYLNYLLDFLNVNKELDRYEKIRQIKKAFKKLKELELLTWEYKHPVNQMVEELPEHYKFHYKKVVEVEEFSEEYFDNYEKQPETEKTQKEQELVKVKEENNNLDLKSFYLNIDLDNEKDLEKENEIPF